MRQYRLVVRLSAFLLTAVTLLVVLALSDFLVGRVNEIANVRIAAQQFRAEAASIGLNVRALVPGTTHYYIDPGSDTGKREFQVGAEGEVTNPSPLETDPDVKIIFLGGSTTENNEVNAETRFPAAVETLLNNSGMKVKSSNFGVRGHTSQESILSYLSKPGMDSATFVVLMHNVNDRLWLANFGDYIHRPHLAAPTTIDSVTRSLYSLLTEAWEYATYRSNIIFLVRQRIEYFNPWSGEPSNPGVVSERNLSQEEVPITHQDLFRRNLQTFISLVKARAATPVLMTQPLGEKSSNHDIFNQIIREIAQKSEVPLIDLASAIQEHGRAQLFFLNDGIHFNNAGSIEAARIIADAFIEKLNAKTTTTQSGKGASVNSLVSECRSLPHRDNLASKAFNVKKALNVSARYPVFSGDGSWLLFQSWARGKESLYAYRTEDSKIFRLSPEGEETPNERHPAIISFSEKSLTFVFGSGYKHGGPELETLMIREWPKMLTSPFLKDKSFGGSIPAVHGEKVYFAGYTKEGPLGTPNILMKDTQSDSLKFITKDDFEDWRPALSPTGDLAFISKRASKFELLEMNTGDTSRVVVEHDQDIWDPAYSPDGKYLAFAAKTGTRWVIKLLNRVSGEIVQVTDGQQDDWDPTFHPSGDLLFFGRSYGREPYIYATCLKGS